MPQTNMSKKRSILYKMCGGRCPECGKKISNRNPKAINEYMTVDHIVPRSKGGTNNIENLRPMCRACNIKRGNDMSGITKRRDDSDWLWK